MSAEGADAHGKLMSRLQGLVGEHHVGAIEGAGHTPQGNDSDTPFQLYEVAPDPTK